MDITDQQLIEKHLALKAHVEARETALTEELKPYRDGMKIIENVFLERFNERGAKNSKTDSGTAYVSNILKITVVDRSALLKLCLDNWDSFGSDMLQIGAVKKPVNEWLDAHEGAPPPGLETGYETKINIRRT